MVAIQPFPATSSPPLFHGRYRLLNQIGAGRYSRVFHALDTHTGWDVALKQMQVGLTAPDQAFARTLFIREAALLSSIAHCRIPRLLNYLAEEQLHTLVTEFAPGANLEALLGSHALPLAQVLSTGINLCGILVYLHHQDPPILHRDLKPANILCTPDGQTSLVDFGIARRFTRLARGANVNRWRCGFRRHTVYDTYGNLGTIGYASPEQYGDEAQTTPRSDLFSLGVILHRMITGEDPAAATKRVSKQTLFTFSSLAGRTVPGLADLIARLVRVDTQYRPESAAQVGQILMDIFLDPHWFPGERQEPLLVGLPR